MISGIRRFFRATTGLILFLLMWTASSKPALANPIVDTIDMGDLLVLMSLRQQDPRTEQVMATLRGGIREHLLGELLRKSQRDPEMKLGALRVSELFEKLENFRVYENRTGTPVVADPERESDFYIPHESWGIVNQSHVRRLSPSGVAALALHVFLGGSGYQDENYQLSLALLIYNQALSDKRSPLNSLPLERLFPQSTEKLLAGERKKQVLLAQASPVERPLYGKSPRIVSNGGFTGVGGGGDGSSVSTKLELLTYIFVAHSKIANQACTGRWRDPLQFAQDVLTIEVESRPGASEPFNETLSDGSRRLVIPSVDANDAKLLEAVVVLSLFRLCEIVVGQP